MVRKQCPPSAATTAQRNKMGFSDLKNYKLILHMTEEKTAKVKPFLFKFRVCVCVCLLPLSSLEKSHMTESFKICSPNFTLFKNGLKKSFFPQQLQKKKNQTKRLLSATGAIQINTAPQGF